MSTKSITITEDAYNSLAALKEGNESFSEVIKRITKKRALTELVGTFTEKDTQDLKKSIAASRKRTKTRLKKHDI